MSQPVYARISNSVSLVHVFENISATLICIASLYAISKIAGVRFDEFYTALAMIAGLLALVLLRSERSENIFAESTALSIGLRIAVRWSMLVGLLLLLGYATKFSAEFARSIVLPWVLVTPTLIWITRVILNDMVRRLQLTDTNVRSAVICGLNSAGHALARRIMTYPHVGYRLCGFFDDRRVARQEHPLREELLEPTVAPILGKIGDLAAYVRNHAIDVVFLALPVKEIRRMMKQIEALRDSTASLYYVPDIFVFDLIQSRTAEFMGVPVVAMCESPLFGTRGSIKRLIDLCIATLALILLCPLMVIIAAAVKFTSHGPVIFKQRRYGLDGQEILVYKFRSMTCTEDGKNVRQATMNDSRVTPVGQFIRRYSLDELPQLLNVIEGSMSLVGPRPHAVAHNEQYRQLIKGYMLRHKVLPGITGLAQVNGCRGETEKLDQMVSRVKYDLDYMRYWSPLLDLKILFQTAITLIRPNGNAY